jgi:hypothetical protein
LRESNSNLRIGLLDALKAETKFGVVIERGGQRGELGIGEIAARSATRLQRFPLFVLMRHVIHRAG